MKTKVTGASSLPDNSSVPNLSNIKDYFQHRRKMERITEFYRKKPMSIKDEQGLPNGRREILQRLNRS